MLRVLRGSYKIIWENGEKETLSCYTTPFLSEEVLNEETQDINNFEDAYNFFHEHYITFGYYTTVSLFNKPIIRDYERDAYITVKNFKPFKAIKTYEDITDKVSIRELADKLNADDFCRFLRDRQVNFSLELTK
jgi:hypothetical protein